MNGAGTVSESSFDQTLTCVDCQAAFTFTEGEQEFYALRAFVPPKRCGRCRATRAAMRQAGAYQERCQ